MRHPRLLSTHLWGPGHSWRRQQPPLKPVLPPPLRCPHRLRQSMARRSQAAALLPVTLRRQSSISMHDAKQQNACGCLNTTAGALQAAKTMHCMKTCASSQKRP